MARSDSHLDWRFRMIPDFKLSDEKEIVKVRKNKKNCRLMFYPDGSVHCTVMSYNVFGGDIFESEERLICYDSDEENERGEYNTDDPRENNLNRARRHIYDLAYINVNSWRYMVTLTLDGSKIDRYNAKEVVQPFKNWLNNMVKRRGLKYLIVPELHHDGAIHFHGLISEGLNLVDSGTVKVPGYKNPIRRATAESFGYNLEDPEVRTVYNTSDYKLGFSTIVPIDNNIEAVSRYMTKYCLKDFTKIFGKTFFAGGHIDREVPTKYIDLPYNLFPSSSEYQLPQFGKIQGSVKYLKADKATVDVILKSLEEQNGF